MEAPSKVPDAAAAVDVLELDVVDGATVEATGLPVP
jgi:hypothetical protein